MLCRKVATVLLVIIVSSSKNEVSAGTTGVVSIQKGNIYHTTSNGSNVYGVVVSQNNHIFPSSSGNEAPSTQSKTIIVTGHPQYGQAYQVSSAKLSNGYKPGAQAQNAPQLPSTAQQANGLPQFSDSRDFTRQDRARMLSIKGQPTDQQYNINNPSIPQVGINRGQAYQGSRVASYPYNCQQMDRNGCDQKIECLNSQVNELKQNVLELRQHLDAVAHAVGELTKQRG